MERHWTRTARVLHWTMALAIFVMVPVGYAMTWTYGAAMKGGLLAEVHLRSSQLHHTLGMIILALAVVRLYWRLRHPAPALPVGTGSVAPRVVQGLLYALLLLLPLSGWAALSALGSGAGYPAASMWFLTHDGFGSDGLIPRIVTAKPWNAPGWFTYGTFAHAHLWMVWGGGVLLAVHVGAALWHHFVRRETVLAAMLGKTPRS